MIKKIVLSLILLPIFIGAGAVAYSVSCFRPADPLYSGEALSFRIEQGESLYSVLDRMEEAGLIRDARPYRLYVRFIHPVSIKKGNYALSPDKGGLELLEILEEGRQELVRITIPEGLSSGETASILEKAGIVSADEFLEAISSKELLESLGIAAHSAEGYLFPDTYYFQKDFPPEKIVATMTETFFETLKKVFPFYADLSEEKLNEKVILASIVEKEYRVSAEAPLIASVFNNRLKIGMPLQSCATVIYVITEELERPHPDRILFRDLELDSPYNTYINDSLPPGPISNPGETALAAAFNPRQSDYLFFVVKDSAAGTHTFTSSLADHNSARAEYIQGFRSK